MQPPKRKFYDEQRRIFTSEPTGPLLTATRRFKVRFSPSSVLRSQRLCFPQSQVVSLFKDKSLQKLAYVVDVTGVKFNANGRSADIVVQVITEL